MALGLGVPVHMPTLKGAAALCPCSLGKRSEGKGWGEGQPGKVVSYQDSLRKKYSDFFLKFLCVYVCVCIIICTFYYLLLCYAYYIRLLCYVYFKYIIYLIK